MRIRLNVTPPPPVHMVWRLAYGFRSLSGPAGRKESPVFLERASGTRLTNAAEPVRGRGPGEAIVLAAAGRKAALADLDGDGVAILRQRISS